MHNMHIYTQGAVMSFVGAIVVVAIAIALATYSNKWNNFVKLFIRLSNGQVPVPPVLDVVNSSTIAATVKLIMWFMGTCACREHACYM